MLDFDSTSRTSGAGPFGGAGRQDLGFSCVRRRLGRGAALGLHPLDDPGSGITSLDGHSVGSLQAPPKRPRRFARLDGPAKRLALAEDPCPEEHIRVLAEGGAGGLRVFALTHEADRLREHPSPEVRRQVHLRLRDRERVQPFPMGLEQVRRRLVLPVGRLEEELEGAALGRRLCRAVDEAAHSLRRLERVRRHSREAVRELDHSLRHPRVEVHHRVEEV